MLRKSFLFFIFACLTTLAVNSAVYAQMAPLNGTVVLEKDGKTEPVAGAVVDVFRTDVKGFYTQKTDKKGEFRFAGILYGEYLISVSAPNCAPIVYPDIRAGQEGLKIVMYPGDGKKFTEAEAKKGATSVTKNNGSDSGVSEEEKKAQAEFAKKNAEITEKNKKIEETNKVINKALTEGAEAFNAKPPNYDLAIAKFDEGYRADPDYEGSAPIMLNNKGKALRERATAAYNQGRQGDSAAKQAARDKAKPDYEEAITTFQKSLEILEKASSGDPKVQESMTRSKIEALKSCVEVQGIMTRIGIVDSPALENTSAILDKYLAAETDEKNKLSVLLTWSNDMRNSGQTKTALHGYSIFLEKTPDNMDAIAGMGLSLFAEGVSNGDKAQMQEGLNLMQKFAETAPETHPLKASVKEAVDFLKNEQKMAPQKAPATPKKKN